MKESAEASIHTRDVFGYPLAGRMQCWVKERRDEQLHGMAQHAQHQRRIPVARWRCGVAAAPDELAAKHAVGWTSIAIGRTFVALPAAGPRRELAAGDAPYYGAEARAATLWETQ